MTKKELIALCVDWLSGGASPSDLTSRYHPLIIAKYLELAHGDFITQLANESIKTKNYTALNQFCRAYKSVPVLHDDDRDEYYSVLPATIMELPWDMGVHQISPMQDQKNKFWYTKNNDADVWDQLEATKVVDNVSYYREGVNIFYDEHFSTDYVKPGLLFKLIVPVSEFADNEDTGITMSNFMIIMDLMRKRLPEKQSNDNSSKTQV